MSETERLRWGHFIVRVSHGPRGMIWTIEDVESSATASFPSPYEMLTFIQTHLVEKEEDVPAPSDAEAL